jgi:hypothetical protein
MFYKMILLALLLSSFSFSAPWTFVVAGDGRSDGSHQRAEDADGINQVITKEIASAVLAEKAKVLMWTGDLVLGYPKAPFAVEPDILTMQLSSWIKLMQPLYDAGVTVLPCRGNHDAKGVNSSNVWRQIFSGKYALPQNGPEPENGFTFYFQKDGVLFLGLDQYVRPKKIVDLEWLDKVLAEHKEPHIFAMGHEPAFMDGNHINTMDTSPQERDTFVEKMIGVGAKIIFFGHDHMYDHMLVSRKTNGVVQEIRQMVAGTSGAPFYKAGEYTGKNSDWTLSRIKSITNTYGYILVTIDGKKADVAFKGRTSTGVYEKMDSFSYSVK